MTLNKGVHSVSSIRYRRNILKVLYVVFGSNPKSRGLEIGDERKAERYIESIGYYHMSAYFYPLLAMQKEGHQYKVGSTFRQALDMYRFDRQLRLLIFNQIEKIEVAVRSAMVSVMSRETGDSFWMTNPVHFANSAKFNSSEGHACGTTH